MFIRKELNSKTFNEIYAEPDHPTDICFVFVCPFKYLHNINSYQQFILVLNKRGPLMTEEKKNNNNNGLLVYLNFSQGMGSDTTSVA